VGSYLVWPDKARTRRGNRAVTLSVRAERGIAHIPLVFELSNYRVVDNSSG
jgi:hypothetical protein